MSPTIQRTLGQKLLGVMVLVALAGGVALLMLTRRPSSLVDDGVRHTLQLVGIGLFAGSLAVSFISAKYRAKNDPAFAQQYEKAYEQTLNIARQWQQRKIQQLKYFVPAIICVGLIIALIKTGLFSH